MHPPQPKKVRTIRSLHGEDFVDDYSWLRDRNDPDTIAYLAAENEYTERATAHLEDLRTQIFAEIKTRTQETDLSAPAKRGEYWYASRTEEGKQYPTHVRMRAEPDGPEEVLLDVNALAADHEYLRVGVFSVSPDGQMLAYSTDTDGSEKYTMRIRDLAGGADLDDVLENTYYSAAWSADGRHLFYTTIDAAHRPDKIWRHALGTAQSEDELVLHEPDDRMFIHVTTSQDEQYVIAAAGSQTTADARYIPADQPTAEWQWVLPREHGVEYQADHREGRWLVVTNDDAVNGRLLSVSVGDPADVIEVIPHDPARKLSGVVAFSQHVIVFGRGAGLTAVTILADGTDPHDLDFDEPVYTVGPERNLEYDTTTLRIHYQSLVTPRRIIDVDLTTGERRVVKETPVLGGFNSSDYTSSRDWATAADGTRIPISIVHRADLDRTRPVPVLLYGYGSYEIPVDPTFSIPRLSILDRGVMFAIAHIRGGGEMGKPWYESGKMTNKANTFEDFIACARHLIDTGVTTPELLVARGGSAGGLLIGAVANMAPELFKALMAQVPFVDVVNTMLDETLPLTVIEWEEWGNPKIEEQYRWIREYSPYDNVDGREYPAMLVTAGLNDPRVSYWEPAKWVAKLREVGTTRGPLLLKTEMGAGHAGPSGRYDAWKDEAFDLAFMLDQVGLAG